MAPAATRTQLVPPAATRVRPEARARRLPLPLRSRVGPVPMRPRARRRAHSVRPGSTALALIWRRPQLVRMATIPVEPVGTF